MWQQIVATVIGIIVIFTVSLVAIAGVFVSQLLLPDAHKEMDVVDNLDLSRF